MKIGFIGLGNVGGKLAGSLFRNKFDLTVYDLDKNVADDFKMLTLLLHVYLLQKFVQRLCLMKMEY